MLMKTTFGRIIGINTSSFDCIIKQEENEEAEMGQEQGENATKRLKSVNKLTFSTQLSYSRRLSKLSPVYCSPVGFISQTKYYFKCFLTCIL